MDPKFPPISLLSTTGKLVDKVILKIVKRHTEEEGLLKACQFGFHDLHIMKLQCVRLTDQVTLNLNNSMSTTAVFFWILKKTLIRHGTSLVI
jgi:hypothetical protein